MRQDTIVIDGPRDFELDRDRSHPLTFTVTWPDEAPAAGLVLIIGGCGGQAETAEGRHRNAREHIVANTGLAAVSVDYHAQQNRPSSGGSVDVATAEHLQLIGLAALAGLKLPDFTDLAALSIALGLSGQKPTVRAKIMPGNGELQNFGVTQALDHLAVIGHLREHHPAFDVTQIFAIGDSHGGYIGHLMMKMAPGVLAGVIDNSSYVQAPLSYLGIGDEAEYEANFNGVTLRCQVESAWSFNNRYAANYFDRNRDLIRDTAYPPHIEIMARASGATTAVSMIHCEIDELTPPGEKLRQAALLRRAGMPAKVHMVQQNEIDGVVFRDYTHALRASLKRVFMRELPWLREVGARGSGQWSGTVDYACIDRGYRFSLLPHRPYVRGEVFELFADGIDAPLMAAPGRLVHGQG